MMNKKGDHVDWAISMGIFLVYLIGMFILLRPGVTPVYKPERLLDILENKFIEKVSWEIREIPLFIKICKPEATLGEMLACEITVEDINEPSQFTVSNIVCEEGGCLNTENIVADSIVCDGSTDKPNLGGDSKSRFRLTYHLKDIEEVDKNAKPKLNIKYSNSNEEYCKSYFGASISKKGIKREWLNELKPKVGKEKEAYNLLKIEWNFPEDKDFSIYYGTTEEDLNKNKLIGAEEPQGINLFIRQFKTQYVRSDGQIDIPVIVNLRVW